MLNLVWLYSSDRRFASAVDDAAAESIGSTSAEFSHEWLCRDHLGDESERAEAPSKVDEPDSIEKLKSDIRGWCYFWNYDEKVVFGWLDRMKELIGDGLNSGKGYNYSSLEDAHRCEIAAMKVEIEKRDRGIERLKRQRDEARAQLEASEELQTKLNETLAERDECAEEISRLECKVKGLEHSLASSAEESQHLRRLCEKYKDAAQELSNIGAEVPR